MEIKERIRDYFKMNDEQKDEILVDILQIYMRIQREQYDYRVRIIDLIDNDIKVFERDEEFEVVQALVDIQKAYDSIIENFKKLTDMELLDFIKNNKDKNV